MQPLKPAKPTKPKAQQMPKADPAPSRLKYRYHRLMLTPMFRRVLRVGLPFAASLLIGLAYFSDEARRDGARLALTELRAEFENRPEFMVKLMAIDGASVETSEDIREIVPLDFPLSSFDIDIAQIHADVTGLDVVKSAKVKVRSGGTLHIDVVERQAIAVWRTYDGLELVDGDGVSFKTIASRKARADLPLIAGEGAVEALGEAMQLMATAAPLNARLRGLARIGARRWDVVLTDGQKIMLPERGAVQALERVLALDAARDVLARDVTAVDMRLKGRPTLKMSEEAVGKRRKDRAIEVGLSSD